MAPCKRTWWKDGTVYQIWPASYKDSNGDGIGDIQGIISTLDYLKDIGIDIIWVSPMYDSPQIDMGYDISNYEDIYPPYGSLADAESLIEACHKRGIRLVFDLVINHTSNLHPWFKDSRSSKDNPKRDWYIWQPAKYDKKGQRMPPNNWRAHFGGSAWEWDETSQEYYLHLFCPEQPDLNWESEAARNAIYESAVKFWLDKGVDGFRVDTVNMYSKGTSFPDGRITDLKSEYQFAPYLFCNGPRVHEFLSEMYEKVLSHYDCMTVGELPHTPNTADVIRYVSAAKRELSMVFQFDIVDLGQDSDFKFETVPFKLTDVKRIIDNFQHLIDDTDAWCTAFLENHDQARSISRYASDQPEHRVPSGKMLALLLTTMTGTLFLYQGQEIGTINCPEHWKAEYYQDVEAVNYIAMIKSRHPDDASALAKAVSGIQRVGRDNARTPVQWDDTPHGGFTTGTPWMRPHHPEINVKQQLSDQGSVLNFWKKMLQMRRDRIDVFAHGKFEMFDKDNEKSLTYTKAFQGTTVLVTLSFVDTKQPLYVPDSIGRDRLRLLVSTFEDVDDEKLGPYEGRAYSIV